MREEGESFSSHSVKYSLVDFTISIAKAFRMTPFEVFKQDAAEVMILIDYYIEKAQDEKPKPKQETHSEGGVLRRRVNDKTATRNWY